MVCDTLLENRNKAQEGVYSIISLCIHEYNIYIYMYISFDIHTDIHIHNKSD